MSEIVVSMALENTVDRGIVSEGLREFLVAYNEYRETHEVAVPVPSWGPYGLRPRRF